METETPPETGQTTAPVATTTPTMGEDPTQPSFIERLRRHWKPLVIGLMLTLLLAGVGYALRPRTAKPTIVPPVPKPSSPTPVPTPVTKASPLTGLPVDPALADRPITGVVIENQTDARPQSGLSQAGVVYEALAEGGITRFEAFYLDQRPPTLGPVRSVRTYFIDWALEFNAPLAHAGGNADALDLISPLGMKDMNQFVYASSFYRSTDRYAPHNLYTSSDLMDRLETQLGFNKPASFTPSPRKADQPEATPTHPKIAINYSYNGYQVEYDYDPKTNDYARFLAGAPHIDRNTGQQLRTKNLVVEIMPTSYGYTRIGEQTVIMQTVGQGKAMVFRDGGVVVGTWQKSSHNARTRLLDANGNDIPLDAGITWYSIVPPDRSVSY